MDSQVLSNFIVSVQAVFPMFASPSALASFTMAQAMDSDSELAGNCVIIGSALSCFTMFLWIFVIKCVGLF